MSVHPIPADMTFQHRLAQTTETVEACLEHWLPLAGSGEAIPPRLAEAMRYSALGGGKRLRPFLVLETARLCGVNHEGAVNAAAALECVHCYSLVHDDLPAMDDDDLRRGRPTVHRAFDEATAILAGDALLTLAFEITADPATHPDPAIRAELTLMLARAAGRAGMAGGQMLDLEAPGRSLGEAEVLRLQAMKTGALIRFGCEAGAVLGGASPGKRDALRRYGALLGQAFQLADDILDVEGDAAVVGKATAKDAEAGKATLVGLIGLADAKVRLAALEAEACATLGPFGEDGRILAEAARFVANRSH
jgi:farnesyl diphosphate synthase